MDDPNLHFLRLLIMANNFGILFQKLFVQLGFRLTLGAFIFLCLEYGQLLIQHANQCSVYFFGVFK